jgi:hypothetical protein
VVTKAIVLSVTVLVTGAAAIVGGAESFPPSLYPPPVPAAPGHGLGLCPNPSGLETFTVRTARLALRVAATYDHKSLDTDLRNSDRAWWPQVRRMWASGHPGKGVAFRVVLGAEPTAKSAYAVFMGPACGASTLAKSLMVSVGPRQPVRGPHCVACNSQLFFVDRQGRALIYYLY